MWKPSIITRRRCSSAAQLVVDTGKQVTLHRTMMQPGLAAEVCGVLEAAGQPASGSGRSGRGGRRIPDQSACLGQRAEAGLDGGRLWAEAPRKRLPSLADYGPDRTITTRDLYLSRRKCRRCKSKIEQNFRLLIRLLCQNLLVPTYGVEVLEIFDPAVNKWEGVLHVARRHEIEAHEIVAIGDDINDLPMIRQCRSGRRDGKRPARKSRPRPPVIGTNREDGLAIFLDELVDLHEVEPVGRVERMGAEPVCKCGLCAFTDEDAHERTRVKQGRG